MALNDLDAALDDLQSAAASDSGDDKMIKRKLAEVKKLMKARNNTAKRVYSAMFAGDSQC